MSDENSMSKERNTNLYEKIKNLLQSNKSQSVSLAAHFIIIAFRGDSTM